MDTKNATRFVTIWLTNSVLFFLANALFPESFELGNANLNLLMAGLVASLLLTVFCKTANSVAHAGGLIKKGRYVMFLYYWLFNTAGVWLLGRFASLTGFGISSYYWAIGLGFFLSIFQWILRQTLKSIKLA